MSDEFIRREDFHGYSDREVLILLAQEVRASLPVINKRLDSHAGDLKELKNWRSYISGGIAVIAAALGLHLKAGNH
jgi:hypothetical protein